VRSLRFDTDAALWFAVAYMGAAFGILPVMLAGLAATGAPLSPLGYIAANAGVQIVAFGTAAALLVRAQPVRRLRDLVFTFYLLYIGAASAMAVLNVIRAPLALPMILAALLAPLTLGAVQVVSLSPLRFADPDVWATVGVCVGFLVGRGYLRLRGRASGSAAAHNVTPMRLPSAEPRDTINTHT
jgi:hypothetical protein